MLQSLRDKSSSWIAKVILALLLIPFAFFGVEQYLQQRIDTGADIEPAGLVEDGPGLGAGKMAMDAS